jgi:hypothetical protein
MPALMYVLVPLLVVVAVALARVWWSGRASRDPVASVDSFHRALEAMQPEGGEPGPGAPDAADRPEG